jgi:CHASE3 domain sensor protein
MRSWSVALTVLIGIAALLSFVAAQELVGSTDRLEQNVAPVLITSQGLVASLAEADAANTSVFLSGADEDRQQRRLYELAIERAPRQIEEVSSLIGNDPSAHDALKDVSSRLTSYVATVEQARAANLQGDPEATETLADAIALISGADGMLTGVNDVTVLAQDDFQNLDNTGNFLTAAAVISILVAIVALVFGQLWLRTRTRRTLNPSMLLGTIVLVVLAAWIFIAFFGRSADLNEAENDVYAAIAETSSLQTEAFDLKTRTASSLIGTTTFSAQERSEAEAQVQGGIDRIFRLVNGDRETAAVTELSVRWDRYAITSAQIGSDLDGGRTAEATARSIGDGNRDFNGFNTAVESVLSDNRDQFLDAAASARSRLDWLRLGSILLPILAALLVLWGWQVRINEYW